MGDAEITKVSWKKRFSHGLTEYLINFAYLSLAFGTFTCYRRLILASENIPYYNYGIAILEALVLAKVIMIGDLLRVGRGFENRPLIIPTIYRTLSFGVWVLFFKFAEKIVRGMLAGKDLYGAFQDIISGNIYEVLAWCVMAIFSFVPFFAVKVLGRVMGEGKLFELFFGKRRIVNG